MSSEAVQTGDYGAGYSSSVFREKGWDPQEGRRRAFEDTDPYAKCVLFIKGEVVLRGKAAIRMYEFRRDIRRKKELASYTSPAKTTTQESEV